MGWDAFGLPAEQYAIRTGGIRAKPPRKHRHFQKADPSLGFSYDWSREVVTTDPIIQMDPMDISSIVPFVV